MASAAQPAGARVRPTTVTVASYLLYAMAALELIAVILGFVTLPKLQRAYQDAFQNVQGGSTAATIATVVGVVVGVLGLLFALAFAILGVFVGRGRNGARITAWIIVGLSVCCFGSGLFGSSFGNSFRSSGNGAPDATEIQRKITAAVPGWYPGVSLTLSVLNLLMAIAVIVLLLLPASNDFFRKTPAQTWEPPVPPAPGPTP